VYACVGEAAADGKCPRDQSRAVVYGRRKWNSERLPDDVRDALEPVANDACLYLEDFVPTVLSPGETVLHNMCLFCTFYFLYFLIPLNYFGFAFGLMSFNCIKFNFGSGVEMYVHCSIAGLG